MRNKLKNNKKSYGAKRPRIIVSREKSLKETIQLFFRSLYVKFAIAGTVVSFCLALVDLYEKYFSTEKLLEKRFSIYQGRFYPKYSKDIGLNWHIGSSTYYYPSGFFELDKYIPTEPDLKSLKYAKESPFKGIYFTAKMEGGKINVNTNLLDASGKVIAILKNNEWILNYPVNVFDRNFNDTSLEVVDHFDRVIFQIDISGNNLFFRGFFNRPDSLVAGILTHNSKSISDKKSLGFICLFHKRTYKYMIEKEESPMIIPRMFNYPSSLHKGQRVN